MRSDCIPVVAHGDQPVHPGHMSLGQFYIGSGDVNQPALSPYNRTSSNVELNGDSSPTPKDLGGSERQKEPSRVASMQLNHSKAVECAEAIKGVDSEYLNKPSNELHELIGSTTIGASEGLALQPTTNNVPAVPLCIDRQVAFQPVSRVCESIEDTWRDPVPNGGWGWLVVFGSFLCMFVVDGVCFSYGMYMQEMIVEGQFPGEQPGVHQSRPSLAALTLPGALLCGTYLLIGPVAGALVNRFDYRCVAMVGALLVTISFTVSALWIYDLCWFTVVFGVVGGIGFGLIYLPAITVVGHWFEQRRAFVVGVAMCGGGLGSGVVAALVRPLARHVAWRGTLILTAALFCQTLIGIALFRPLYVHELIKIAQRHRQRRQEARRLTEASKKHEAKKKKKAGGQPKSSGERKAYFQRGSIMARIIEEKSRQRTTSTGSLDGMVITRENELAPLSDPDAYEALMAAAAAYVSQCQTSEPGKTATAVPNTGTGAVVTESSSSTTTSSITPTSAHERPAISTVTPSSRGPGNLQTVKEGVAFPTQNTAPVAVLPPPVQFSRTAVRRIACAILRKLHSANLLPSYLSASTTNASRHRSGQFYSPLIGAGSRTDSWITFDAITSSRQPVSEHPSGVYDAIDPDVTSLRERVSERKASLGAGVGLKKLSLRHESLPQSDLSVIEVSRIGARERPTSRTVTSSRLSAQNEISRSPSQLASMVSLDSRTDQVIAQELRLLPLDAQTKDAVLAALRAELSRPKYRADFFHCSGRKPSGTEPEVELRTSLTEPGTQFRMPPDSGWKRGSGLPTYEVFPTASSSSPVPARASNNQISPIRAIDPSRVNRELPIANTVTAVPGAMRVSVLEDPGPRLWDWLSDPVELNDPGDEILAYLREMLDWRLLFSVTFLVLLVACSLNMLVLLVPFHFLPLLLEFGGMECRTNTLWCPEGLPSKSDHSWLTAILTWPSDGTAFVSPGAILLTIGISSIVGRLLAAMYIEKGVGTGCRAFQRCPCVGDPLLLNNVLLILCAFSLACFPLSVHGVIVTPSRSDRDDFDQFGDDEPKQIQAWTIEFRLMLFFMASVVYGLASAISLSLRSVILVELFGIRRLTNAFGYLLIFQGLAVILGPPLFGHFCDGECHGYLDYCGLPGSVPTRHSFFHNTACAKRLVYAFYICAALFLLTSLLFMPLRWLARHDAECTARCMRTVRRTAAPPVFPSSSMGPDPTLVPGENFPMGSVYSAPNAQYDPQQTQTTQILPEVE